MNKFFENGLKESAKTLSNNGSLKFDTTGNDFIDQFAGTTSWIKPREYKDIKRDFELLYDQDKEMTVRFTIYLRTITRQVKFPDGSKTEKVQAGQGLKHESMARMYALYMKDKDVFWKNIEVYLLAGSWKDIIKLMMFDLEQNDNDFTKRKIDWNELSKIILLGLENENTTDLVKKYLPKIRTKKYLYSKNTGKLVQSRVNRNVVAKYLCNRIFGSHSSDMEKFRKYKKYSKLKSSGTAHQWQQHISRNQPKLINFNTIAGKALMTFASTNYIKNHGLEDKYLEWIKSKPVANFTGYPYELFKNVKHSQVNKIREYTIEKQMETLLKKYKTDIVKGGRKFLGVLDASGSMGIEILNSVSAFDIGKAMSLTFSQMLDGYFKDYFVEFNDEAKLIKFKGDTYLNKFNSYKSGPVASTDPVKVAHLFVDILKAGTPIEDFPTGLVMFSDGEFNRQYKESWYRSSIILDPETNFNKFRSVLLYGGFPEEYVNDLVLVMWDISKDNPNFETFGDNVKNVFYMSGADLSPMKFLMTGETVENEEGEVVLTTPKTPKELFLTAVNQELTNFVKI